MKCERSEGPGQADEAVGPEQPLDDLKFGNLTVKTFWREMANTD